MNGGGGSGTFGNSLAAQTGRMSNATEASFTQHALSNPFPQVGFRWVAKGVYTKGDKAGEACVCKWFKSGVVFQSTFFELDIKAVDKAHQLIQKWNARGYVNKGVMINMPKVWTFKQDDVRNRGGSKVLQEPFISNYEKCNSNTGWADDSTPWPRVMQILSHFSYHASESQYLFCDLQGGVYSNAVCLTDPVILSRDKSYGVTDLGPTGISSFFSNHKCNEFCTSSWSRPADPRRCFIPQAGTSMMSAGTNGNKHVPTRHSRSSRYH